VTTYALAAFMVSRGMLREAWCTASGIARVVEDRGYWFRTPEAYDINGNFRATLYLRPLAIWAIEHALAAKGLAHPTQLDDRSVAIGHAASLKSGGGTRTTRRTDR
jgi:hypothetical protein